MKQETLEVPIEIAHNTQFYDKNWKVKYIENVGDLKSSLSQNGHRANVSFDEKRNIYLVTHY